MGWESGGIEEGVHGGGCGGICAWYVEVGEGFSGLVVVGMDQSQRCDVQFTVHSTCFVRFSEICCTSHPKFHDMTFVFSFLI